MSGASKAAAKRTRFVFTDTALKRLPSTVKKDTDYYDQKTPGLICRVLPPRKGYSAAERRVFYFRRTLWVDGKKARPKVRLPRKTHADKDCTVDHARDWAAAQAKLDKIFNDKNGKKTSRPKAKVASAFTVSSLCTAYIKAKAKKKGWTKPTTDRCHGRIKNYLGGISNVDAELLTFEQADNWKWWLHEHVGECTGSITYRMVKQAYAWAAAAGGLPRTVVCPLDQTWSHQSKKEVKTFTYQQMCEAWFIDEESLARTYKNNDDTHATRELRKQGICYLDKLKELQHCVQLMFLTGAREHEIEYLTWRQYQWYDNVVTKLRRRALCYAGDEVKNRVPYVKPLPVFAQAIMDEQRKMYPNAGADDRVFQTFTHRQTLYYLFTRRLKFDVSSHNMRKTCTTGWSMLGIDKEIKQKLLHHTDHETIDKHYDKWDYFHEKQQALDLWTEHLFIALEKYDPTIEYNYTNNDLKDYIHEHGTITTVVTPSLASLKPKQSKRLPAA